MTKAYVLTHKAKYTYYPEQGVILGIFELEADAKKSKHRKMKAVGKVKKEYLPSYDDPNTQILVTRREYKIDSDAGCCTIKAVEFYPEGEILVS